MNKYKNKKCEYYGINFDSQHELDFYMVLLKWIDQGIFEKVELQPKFELIPKYEYQKIKHQGIFYTADFMAIDCHGKAIIYDIKGMETQQGNLRRKLFQWRYPDKNLVWLSKSIKYGVDGFIDYDELKKIRSKNKKEKTK